MNQEKIGKFIVSCRKKQNLTQEQLAEKLGITYKAVSKWEARKDFQMFIYLKVYEIYLI